MRFVLTISEHDAGNIIHVAMPFIAQEPAAHPHPSLAQPRRIALRHG
jgi:hypothetical protein